MATSDTEDQITKKRVTMRSASIVPGAEGPKGQPVVQQVEAVDYVREDFLDAYVADARNRWQSVEVSDEYDAGPGGYHGATAVPDRLDHPLAGQIFAATKKKG